MLLPYSFLICVLFPYHPNAANEQEAQIPLESIISMNRAHLKDPNYDTCVGGNSCCTGVYRCALGEGDCDPAREDSYYGRPGRMRTVVRGPRKQCMSGLVCSTNDCQTYDYLLRETFPYHRRSLNFNSTDDCWVLPEERRWEWEEWLAREMERKSRTKN